MSYGSDSHIEATEQICADYCERVLPRDQAMRELWRLGYDSQEARDLLDGSVA